MKIGARQYAQGMVSACSNKTDKEVFAIIDAFVKRMIFSGKRRIVREVLEEVQLLIDQQLGVVRANIVHTPGIGDATLGYIKKSVRKVAGVTDVTTQEDQELLGGIAISIKDRVIDASLASRLEAVKNSLLAE